MGATWQQTLGELGWGILDFNMLDIPFPLELNRCQGCLAGTYLPIEIEMPSWTFPLSRLWGVGGGWGSWLLHE